MKAQPRLAKILFRLKRLLRIPWRYDKFGYMVGEARRYLAGLRQLNLSRESAEYRTAYRAAIRAARDDAFRLGLDDAFVAVAIVIALAVLAAAPISWRYFRAAPINWPARSAEVRALLFPAIPLGLTVNTSKALDVAFNELTVFFAVLSYLLGFCVVLYSLFVPQAIEALFCVALPASLKRKWVYLLTVTFGVISCWPNIPHAWYTRLLISMMFGVFMMFILIMFVEFSRMMLVAAVGRSQVADRPDSAVIARSLRVLADLGGEKSQEQWLSPHFRHRIIDDIDFIASAFERFWWRCGKRVRGSAGFRNRCASIGAAFRDRTFWLAVPKADTREYLNREFKTICGAIIAGNLDALPIQAVSGTSAWQRVRVYSTTITIALLPMIFLGLLQVSPLRLPETTIGWISLVTFVWAIVTGIAAIDPLLGSKIGLMKDLRELFSSKQGKDAA